MKQWQAHLLTWSTVQSQLILSSCWYRVSVYASVCWYHRDYSPWCADFLEETEMLLVAPAFQEFPSGPKRLNIDVKVDTEDSKAWVWI